MGFQKWLIGCFLIGCMACGDDDDENALVVSDEVTRSIVGTWELEFRDTPGCKGSITWNANGTWEASEVDNRSTGTYEFEAEGSTGGLHSYTQVTLTDNAGIDCGDQNIDTAGQEVTLLFLFEDNDTIFIGNGALFVTTARRVD